MKGCRQYLKQKQSQHDLSLSASKNAWYLTSAVFEACLASFGTESQGVNFSGGWIRKCFENVKMLLYQFSEIPLIFEINKCSSSSMELENRNRINQFNCSVWLVVYNTSLTVFSAWWLGLWKMICTACNTPVGLSAARSDQLMVYPCWVGKTPSLRS